MFSIIVVSFKIKSHKSSRLHRKLNSVPGERADGAEWGIFISSNNSNDAYDWGTYSWQTFDLFQLFLLNEVITKSYFSKYVCYFLESEQKTRESDIFCSHATSTNCRFAPVSKSSRFVRIWKNFFSVFNIFFGNFFSFFFVEWRID